MRCDVGKFSTVLSSEATGDLPPIVVFVDGL